MTGLCCQLFVVSPALFNMQISVSADRLGDLWVLLLDVLDERCFTPGC